LCIAFHRAQGVGDVTQRLQYDALVIGYGGIKSGERRSFSAGSPGLKEAG
jgi:hypothetical protein